VLEPNSEIHVVFRYNGRVVLVGIGEVYREFWWGQLI